MKRIDYGIDAPHVVRNLFIFSAIGFLLPVFVPLIKIGQANIYTSGFIWMGISCGLMAAWMLLYSIYGKLKHRDRILNMIDWKGSEVVLDIGTGRGLLAIGAAKRLTSGKSIGIDIWNTEDLSKNKIENTINNVALEGVKDKVEIKNDNVMSMSFADDTFDIVISNLCLHNIYNIEDRKKACNEICRVLREGGTGVISDFKHIKEYKNNFVQLGLQTEILPASYFTTFPPLAILKINKV
ncbi:MAG: class I SAM-dependent methyltransferase [Chitinophagales bacterium]